MACVVFLLIAVYAASEATLYCSIADDSGSSSMNGPQQVSTLEYCVVDNCTIMRIDNGQKLDIVYILLKVLLWSTQLMARPPQLLLRIIMSYLVFCLIPWPTNSIHCNNDWSSSNYDSK